MSAVELLQWFVAAWALFWTLFLVGLPLLARLRRRRASAETGGVPDFPLINVLIPAHDMQDVIGDCIRTLRECRYPPEKVRIVVVADHCSDATSDRAAEAGAIVLVRSAGLPGKTYAIAWAIEQERMKGLRADACLVTDATARLDTGFLEAIARRLLRGEDVVVGRSVAATAGQPWFVHCLGLTLVHRNYQNECRERLGLSSLIEGRGMAYSSRYLERFGWTLALPAASATEIHPTEDWRHGVRMVEEGLRAAFAGDARVMTPLRGTLRAATAQGRRWERGRLVNAMTHGMRLLVRGIRERNRLKIISALDAIQPPAAVLAVVTAMLAGAAALRPANGPLAVFSVAPAALVLLYGLVVVWRGRAEGIGIGTVAWAPLYVAWRSYAFLFAWMRR